MGGLQVFMGVPYKTVYMPYKIPNAKSKVRVSQWPLILNKNFSNDWQLKKSWTVSSLETLLETWVRLTLTYTGFTKPCWPSVSWFSHLHQSVWTWQKCSSWSLEVLFTLRWHEPTNLGFRRTTDKSIKILSGSSSRVSSIQQGKDDMGSRSCLHGTTNGQCSSHQRIRSWQFNCFRHNAGVERWFGQHVRVQQLELDWRASPGTIYETGTSWNGTSLCSWFK